MSLKEIKEISPFLQELMTETLRDAKNALRNNDIEIFDQAVRFIYAISPVQVKSAVDEQIKTFSRDRFGIDAGLFELMDFIKSDYASFMAKYQQNTTIREKRAEYLATIRPVFYVILSIILNSLHDNGIFITQRHIITGLYQGEAL